MIYFERAGKENTEATLKVAIEEADRRGIRHLVVASTYGDTGLRAAQMLQGQGIKLIVVTHNVGFAEEGKDQFEPEKRRRIESQGGVV